MTTEHLRQMASRDTRLWRGLTSSAVALFARIVVQLAQIPLFLHFWSVERYGEWLLLITIPSYLALSGLGLSSVGGNYIASAVTAGNTARACGIFRVVWLLVSISNLALIVAAGGALQWFDSQRFMHFATITSAEGARTIFLLVLLVVLRLQSGVNEAAFRARGAYGEYLFIETSSQVAELVMSAVSLLMFKSTVAVAASLVLVRMTVLAGLLLHLWKNDRWLLAKGDLPTTSLIPELLVPSIALQLFPIAFAIQDQGITILIGSVFGPTEVATFVTLRTFSRAGDMLLSMFHNMAQNEVAYAAGSTSKSGLRKIFTFGVVGCAFIITIFLIGMLIAGPKLFEIWAGDKLHFEYGIFYVVLMLTVYTRGLRPSKRDFDGCEQNHGNRRCFPDRGRLFSHARLYCFALFEKSADHSGFLEILVRCV